MSTSHISNLQLLNLSAKKLTRLFNIILSTSLISQELIWVTVNQVHQFRQFFGSNKLNTELIIGFLVELAGPVHSSKFGNQITRSELMLNFVRIQKSINFFFLSKSKWPKVYNRVQGISNWGERVNDSGLDSDLH